MKKTDQKCHKCGKQMTTWDVRLTKTFKTYPTCEECFCDVYDMDQDAFRDRMEEYFDMRPCKGI